MNNNVTSQVKWQSKTFSQLSIDELYELLKLRIDVFVVEQTCFYPDLDDKDRHVQALHLQGYKKNKLAAYLRILPKGESYDDYISIGRVVIAPDARGSGLGHDLMKQALLLCEQYFPKEKLKISAQEHLESYYNKHGFVRVSEMYLEDDIPHIAMVHQIN